MTYRADAEYYLDKAISHDPLRDPRQDAVLALTCAIFALLERLDEQLSHPTQGEPQ